MTSSSDRPRATGASVLRRVIVGVIVVAFAIAAIGGIIVLLGAQLEATSGRVLVTTAVVGLFSIAVLCCAALIGRPLQIVGVIGAGVSVVAALLAIWMIWVDYSSGAPWETLWRTLWTAVAASVAFSVASLLLLLVGRRRPVVRIGLFATLGIIALLLVLTVYLTWARDIEWESFGRLYGIVAILAALGTVVVPVLSLLVRDERPAPTRLSPVGAALLEDEALRRGVSPDELVRDLLGVPAAASGESTPAATDVVSGEPGSSSGPEHAQPSDT